MMKKVLSIVLTVCMLFTMVVIPTVTATAATTVTNPEGQSAWKFDFSAEGGYYDYDNPVSPEGVTYDWTAVGYGGNYKIEQTSDFRRAELNTPMDALRIRMEGDRRNMSLVPLLPNGQPIVLEPGKTYTVNINFYISGSGAEDRPLIAPFSTLDGFGDRTNYSTNAKDEAGNKLPLRSATNFGSHRSLFSDSQIWYYNPNHWSFGSSYGEKYTPKMLNEEGVLVDGPEATINRGMGYRSVGYTDKEKTITFTVPTLEQLANYNVTVNEDGSYAYNGQNFNNFFALEFTGVLNNDYYGLYASATPNLYEEKTPAADFIGKAYESALTKGEDANGNKYFKMFSEFYITSLSVIEVQGTTGAAVFHEGDGKITTVRGEDGTAVDLTPKPAVPEGKEFLGWYTDAACTKPAVATNYVANQVFNFYAKFGTVVPPATNPEGESAWFIDLSKDGGYWDYENPVNPGDTDYDFKAIASDGNYKVEYANFLGEDAMRIRVDSDRTALSIVPLQSNGKPIVMEPGKTYSVTAKFYNTSLAVSSQRFVFAPYSTLNGSGNKDGRTVAKDDSGNNLPLGSDSWVLSNRGLFADGQVVYMGETNAAHFEEKYSAKQITGDALVDGPDTALTRGMGFIPTGKAITAKQTYTMPTVETLETYNVVVNADGSFFYNGNSYNNFFALELPATSNNDYYGVYADGSTGKAYDSALTKGEDANGTKYFKMFSEYYITELSVVEYVEGEGTVVFHDYDGIKTVNGEDGVSVDIYTPNVPENVMFEGWYADASFETPIGSIVSFTEGEIIHIYGKFTEIKDPATNADGEKLWSIDLSENGYFDYDNPVDPSDIGYDWKAIGSNGNYKVEHATFNGQDAMRIRVDGDRTAFNIVPLQANGKPIVMEAGKTYTISVKFYNTALGVGDQRFVIAPYSTITGYGNTDGRTVAKNDADVSLGLREESWVKPNRGLFADTEVAYLGNAGSDFFTEAYLPFSLTDGALTSTGQSATRGMGYIPEGKLYSVSATYTIPTLDTMEDYNVTQNYNGSYAYGGRDYNNFLSLEFPATVNADWAGLYADASQYGTDAAYNSALSKGTDDFGSNYFKIFSEYYITEITVMESDGETGIAIFHNPDGTTTTVTGANGTAIDMPSFDSDSAFEKFGGWFTDAELTKPATDITFVADTIINLYPKFTASYFGTTALSVGAVDKGGEQVTALRYNPLTIDEFVANGGKAEDYVADTYDKPGNGITLGAIEDGATYKISFSYKSDIMETPFGLSIAAGSLNQVWPMDNYLLGSRDARYYVDTTTADGQWHTYNIFFTADLNGTLTEDQNGFEDIKEVDETRNILYLYFLQETGDSFESFEGYEINIDMVDFTVTKLDDVVVSAGVSILEEEYAAIAGAQALRYYFSYDTEDYDTIKVGNETFEIVERGFVLGNGNIATYAEAIEGTNTYKYTGNKFTVNNRALTKIAKTSDFDTCWDYIEDDQDLIFSTYVSNIGPKFVNSKIFARGYVTFVDDNGVQHTVYSDVTNASVAAVEAANAQ